MLRGWLWCKNHVVYRSFIGALVWVHLILTFWEAPVDVGSSGRASMALNLAIGITFVVNALVGAYWRRRVDGRLSLRMLAQAGIAALYIADAGLMYSFMYTTGIYKPTRIPYTAVLRPAMLLLITKSEQRTIRDICVAVYMSRQVFLLGGLLFGVSVVVILSLTVDAVGPEMIELATTQGVGFGSFTSAVLTLFNMVFTGANLGPGMPCPRQGAPCPAVPCRVCSVLLGRLGCRVIGLVLCVGAVVVSLQSCSSTRRRL